VLPPAEEVESDFLHPTQAPAISAAQRAIAKALFALFITYPSMLL
jgi:hypothetical protein